MHIPKVDMHVSALSELFIRVVCSGHIDASLPFLLDT